MQPIDLALVVHKYCEDFLIPEGHSPNHSINVHAPTTEYYVNQINQAELNVTPEQVFEAILIASGWDKKGPWPGHPHPDKVILALKLD